MAKLYRYLSLERAIPLFIAAGIALFSLLQIVFASYLISKKFDTLELMDLEGRRDQFRILMEREEEALRSITQSYAEWITSYEYVESRNPGYPSDNYPSTWFATQKIDNVIVISEDGEVLWSNVFFPGVTQSGGATYLSDDQKSLLFPSDYGTVPPRPISGFMSFGYTHALYVAWPITNDTATVEPNGILVFVRNLTPQPLARFAPGDDFSVAYLPVNYFEPTIDTAVRSEEKGGVTQFTAYDPVTDAKGAVIGYWHYRKTVRWRNIARSLLTWFIIIALSGGLGVCLSASFLVRRFMVMPIKSIRNYLRRFSESFTAEEPPGSLRHDEIGDLAIYIHLLTEKIERQTRELDRLASTDGLTGLPNRRCLDETLAELERKANGARGAMNERTSPKRGSVACGIIDVDFFKKYNDRYGHAEGDEVLKRIASAIGEGVRQPKDLPSRYGGEEFAVVLPETDEAGAVAVLDRIRARVEALGIPHAGSSVSRVVTISAGAAAFSSAADAASAGEERIDMAALFKLADQALYLAKSSGRNRVAAASTLEIMAGIGAVADDPGAR